MTALVASVALAFVPHSACAKTFTVKMAQRAARAAYVGTRTVTVSDRRHLARFKRCQRNPHAKQFVAWYYARERRLHRRREQAARMSYATASWYEDAGSTASGFHAYYGVANLSLPFGTHVRFCYSGRCLTATVDDRGPYVGGRMWDLNQNTAGALGFSGVQTVGYAVK